MNFFDEEQILKSYIRSERYEAAQKTAREITKRMIEKGRSKLIVNMNIFLYNRL